MRIPFTFSIDPKEYKRIDGLEIVNSTFSPNNDKILDDNLINYYLVTPVEDIAFHANLITKDRVTYQGTVYQGKTKHLVINLSNGMVQKLMDPRYLMACTKSKLLLLTLAEKQSKQERCLLTEQHLS